MLANRSSPTATVIPALAYDDVGRAVDWLCDAFGFRERLRIGSHRAQLTFGDGAVIVTERRAAQSSDERSADTSHSVHVRVEDVDQHYERVRQRGTRIIQPPESYP